VRSALVRRQRKGKPLRLVVLLDASGSMSHVHQRVPALHPWRAQTNSRGEAFLFHTRIGSRLRRIQEKDAGSALDRLSLWRKARAGDPDRREPEDLQPLDAERVIIPAPA